MKPRNNKKLILFIIMVAILLRFSFLGSIPSGLHYQEANIGWRAQNLLYTGKDEFGRYLPLFFYNWKDVELPLTTYLTVPFLLFSKEILFLRLPFAIVGVFFVIGGMLLTRKLFIKEQSLYLYVGLILAIAPWSWYSSRTVSPQMLSITLLVCGLYFLFLKGWKIYLGLFFVVLTFLANKISLFFIPIFLGYFFIKHRQFKFILILGVFYFWILIALMSSHGGLQSLKDNDFSIFKDASFINNINLVRGEDLESNFPFHGNIFYNKAHLIIKILGNSLSLFNPRFIFASGDGNLLNSPKSFGLIPIVFFPFLLIGLYKFSQLKSESKSLIVLWFICSTLPCIFLLQGVNSSRYIFALYPLSLFIALGLSSIKNKYLLSVVFVLIIYNLSIIIYNTFNNADNETNKIWNPQTIKIAENIDINNKTWLTDSIDPNPGPVIAYLKEIKYDQTNFSKTNVYYRAWLNRIGNLYIGNIESLKKGNEDFEVFILDQEQSKKTPLISPYSKLELTGEYTLFICIKKTDSERFGCLPKNNEN